MRSIWICGLLLALSVTVPAGLSAQFFDDFARPDGPVDGWTTHQGDWMIEGEALVVTSPGFRQTDEPYIWAGDPAISVDRPFEASLSFEFTAPTRNTARYNGGIMFCAEAPLTRWGRITGYTIEWLDAPPAPRWVLFRWDGGGGPAVEVRAASAVGLPATDWSLEVTDDRIIFSVGGVEVINHRDATYRGGHFGVWVFGTGGAVRVDDVNIISSPEAVEVPISPLPVAIALVLAGVFALRRRRASDQAS